MNDLENLSVLHLNSGKVLGVLREYGWFVSTERSLFTLFVSSITMDL